MTLTTNQLALCSWSVRPQTPVELAEQCDAIGLKRVQLALAPVFENPSVWGRVGQVLADAGISVVSGMYSAVDEDYSTPERIRETGGIVPNATWERNWANAETSAQVARALGIDSITTHAGFIPENEDEPQFAVVVERILLIADLFADVFGGSLALETGQESAATLNRFLGIVNRPNVLVNFDPANMLLYEMGDPVDAVRQLVGRLGSVHLKDANRGWGQERPLGEGEVDWDGFLGVLDEAGFAGTMAIEREGGEDRVDDIRRAVDFISACISEE